ncbi:SDR family oxidoreductase [Comamonas sp. MYb69]|uniref:SDR family oxidoreductase n=1 Tax=Comamonas sp. MYb69 TaxID=1848650 RepID=UPI0030B2AB9E
MSTPSTPSTPARPRVLITGGGAGIGAAAALRCHADGYDPVIIDRQIDQVPAGFVAIQADLSSAEDTARALGEALAGGAITRLVNNVGIVVPNDAASQTLAEFDLAVSLNLRCAFQCMQALLPGMQEARFGRIVNMSSRAALGKDLRTAYAATKAGLIGMTRVWALELGQWGITANAIGPGPIRTELFDKANPPGAERTQKIIQSVPVKRVGTPDDVAHAVAYMLDERSGFVTGQALYVCGGMTVGVAPV